MATLDVDAAARADRHSRPREPCRWLFGPPLPLAAEEVHVWRVDLDGPAPPADELGGLLPAEELERVRRLRRACDRRRKLVLVAALRVLAGRYLARDSTRIHFTRGPFGKPGIPASDIRFNVSDADCCGLIAFARGREVGVDIERLQGGIDHLALARLFFTPRDLDKLAALAGAERARAFFECWTRKEAYVKARGEGLTIPPDAFEVAFGPGEEPRLLSARDAPEDPGRFAFAVPAVPRGFVAALAFERSARGAAGAPSDGASAERGRS